MRCLTVSIRCLTTFYPAHVTSGITFSVNSKLIRKPFKPEEWIDRSYLDKAIKDLALLRLLARL